MTHFIDITREHCPMTMVKVKLKLAEVPSGYSLEVLLSDGEPKENVPKSAREQGYEVKELEPRPPHFRYLIRKP